MLCGKALGLVHVLALAVAIVKMLQLIITRSLKRHLLPSGTYILIFILS